MRITEAQLRALVEINRAVLARNVRASGNTIRALRDYHLIEWVTDAGALRITPAGRRALEQSEGK